MTDQRFFGFSRPILMFLLLGALCILPGCAKTLGIYDTDYGCPRMENGECLPVDEAHEKAVADSYGQEKKEAVVHTNFIPDPREEEEFLDKEVNSFKTALRKFEFCMSRKRSEQACAEERDKLLDQFKTAEDRGRAKELHGVDMQERVVRLAAMESMVDRGSNTIPIRQPDTVLELHIMPYRTGFGALVSERVIWIVVQEGAWTWATTEGTDAAKSKIGALQ